MKGLFLSIFWLITCLPSGGAQEEVDLLPLHSQLPRIFMALDAEDFRTGDSLAQLALNQSLLEHKVDTAAICHHLIGRCKEMEEDLEGAFEHYQQSLAIWDSLGEKFSMGEVCRDMSILMEQMGDTYEKILYAEQGLRAARALDSFRLLADLSIELGNGLKDAGSFARAESAYIEAQSYFNEIDDTIGIAMAQYGEGELNFQFGRDEEAEILIREALSIFAESGEDYQLAQSYNVLGGIYMEKEDLQQAKDYLRESLSYAEKAENLALQFDANVNLATTEYFLGNVKAARRYYQQAKLQLSGSNPSADKIFLEDLEVLLEIQEDKLKMQRNIVAISLLGLLFVMFLIFINYRNRKTKEREEAKKQAEREKEELRKEETTKREEARKEAARQIEAEKKEKEVQKRIAFARERAIMHGEQEERERLRKLVHHHIGSQMTAINWNLDGCITALGNKKLKKDDLKKTKAMVSRAEKASRNIEKLLEDEAVGIDWLQRIYTFFNELDKAPGSNCNFQLICLDLECGLQGILGKSVYEIIQIGISNSLRHAEAKRINCQLNRIEDELIIVMEDNGKGFDQSTPVEGIGLKSLKQLTRRLEGKEQIDSQLGHGTTISVTCPFYN